MEKIDRREFLKIAGAAGAALVAGGCAAGGGESSTGSSSLKPGGGNMTYRVNPKTSEKVSLLGYGCMRWPLLDNPLQGQSVIDQEEVNRLVDFAIEHGITYFDTAPLYIQGWSEPATGKALSRHPRESYTIATKLSNFNDFSAEAAKKMYHNSFKRLQVDYIDYYLLHAVGGGSGMELLRQRFFDNGILDFLIEERSAGRIRNLGFSYHGDVKVFDYLISLHDQVKWDFVQIQMNYVDWHNAVNDADAEYLYGELSSRGIPVVIMEPLLGGRLAKVNEHITQQFKMKRPKDSVASWAFRFAGSYPGVLTVLSGMTYMEHLVDNLSTYSPLEPLSQQELEFLLEAGDQIAAFPVVPCTGCQYCMPCPYGVNIPAVFAHYNKCITEGAILDTSGSEYKKARREYLIGYDRAVPKLRQADHCIGCGRCLKHCPQQIKIPRMMREIDEFTESLKQQI